jgi:hypothetical protein
MLEGTCLCGAVNWRLTSQPDSATACNCTACRRYGVLWAYGHEGDDVFLSGTTTAFVRGKALGFHFCPTCGNLAAWRALQPGADGRRRMAVNLRLAEPEAVVALPIDHFDGFVSWSDLPRDGRCVRDLWF